MANPFDDILASDAQFMCGAEFSEEILYTRNDGSEAVLNMVVNRDEPSGIQDAQHGNAPLIVASVAVADFIKQFGADPDTGGDTITTYWRQNGPTGDFRLIEIRTTDPGAYTLIFSGSAPKF